MPAPLRLEVFAPPDPAQGAHDPATEARDALVKAAYEDGYAAGWEDALAHTADEAATRRARAEDSLQALCFTQAEAQAQVLAAMRPLFACIAGRVLPELARRALAPLVADEIERLARARLPARLELVCAAGLRAELDPLLARFDTLAISVREDPGYGSGQVSLRCAEAGTDIDVDSALATITTAIEDFFEADTGAPAPLQETRTNA